MTKTVRNILIAAAAIIAGAVFLIASGCSSTPTKFETRLFDVQTNEIPVIIRQTNVVRITNAELQTVLVTNVVLVPMTNYTYEYKPGSLEGQIKQTGGDIGSLFGVGGLVTTALGFMFGIWRQVRSSKNYRTAASLAQSIETARQFIKGLPNGDIYDAAFVQWLQAHQGEGNVINEVVSLLENEVSNPEAKEAAATIRKLLEALKTQTPTG